MVKTSCKSSTNSISSTAANGNSITRTARCYDDEEGDEASAASNATSSSAPGMGFAVDFAMLYHQQHPMVIALPPPRYFSNLGFTSAAAASHSANFQEQQEDDSHAIILSQIVAVTGILDEALKVIAGNENYFINEDD